MYIVSTAVQNKIMSDILSCYNAIQSTPQHMYILIFLYYSLQPEDWLFWSHSCKAIGQIQLSHWGQ